MRPAAVRRETALPRPATQTADSRIALAGGILGIAMLPLLLMIFPLTIGLAQFVPGSTVVVLGFWYLSTASIFAGSVVAVALAVPTRLSCGP